MMPAGAVRHAASVQHATRPRRVLFVCVPQTGHVTPLLPLARAYDVRGDDVVVASGPAARAAVEAAGLTFRAICADLDEWFARLAERTPGRPGDGLPPQHVERYFVPRLFGEIGLAAMLDGLDDALRAEPPDLVLFEPYALAAPLVAARHGVRSVRHTIGLPTDALVAELVTDAVTPAWSAAGLAAKPDGDLTVDICPPSLGGDAALRMRPTEPPDPAAPLPVATRPEGRPLVYVTLGTFSNTNLPLFRTILSALADLPVAALVTTGGGCGLDAVPDNVTVTEFVPQGAVLPHCAAVVQHGGAGTAFGVLGHGLPSLVLPQSADNFRFADRMRAAGTARVLMPDQVTEQSVRTALQDVLSASRYRNAATRVAAEIAELPSPAEIVTALDATFHREEPR